MPFHWIKLLCQEVLCLGLRPFLNTIVLVCIVSAGLWRKRTGTLNETGAEMSEKRVQICLKNDPHVAACLAPRRTRPTKLPGWLQAASASAHWRPDPPAALSPPPGLLHGECLPCRKYVVSIDALIPIALLFQAIVLLSLQPLQSDSSIQEESVAICDGPWKERGGDGGSVTLQLLMHCWTWEARLGSKVMVGGSKPI